MSLDVRVARQAEKDLEALSPTRRRRVAHTTEERDADGRGDLRKLSRATRTSTA